MDDEEDSDEDDVDLNPYESTPGDVVMDGVPDGTRFVQVVAGDNATFALTEEGTVYGWGTFRVCLIYPLVTCRFNANQEILHRTKTASTPSPTTSTTPPDP